VFHVKHTYMTSKFELEETKTILHSALKANSIDAPVDINKLLNYLCILAEWNKIHNLTSHRSLNDIIFKDIIDSLIAAKHLNGILANCKYVMDFGAGAGFSGVVISLLHQNIEVTFSEASRKKANFIRQVMLDLKIDGKVQCGFLDSSKKDLFNRFDLIIGRAVTQVPDFICTVQNYVHNKGHLAYMAGPNQILEIENPKQGVELETIIPYTILPYNYFRKLAVYKKNIVSRETDTTH